jgi:beta-lactamase regulating signal transducer with metallopeptidase domain
MSEFVTALVEANLAGSAAIAAVLALRLPARKLFGPEVAYGLWALPVLAAAATLLPARTDPSAGAAEAQTLLTDAVAIAAPLWLAGALAVAAAFAYAQARFLETLKDGRAGPAVVGVIAPRLVMPADDGTYTAEERALIRAHEREHIARKDPRAGALAAAAQCLCWFNPLVHYAAHLVRLDQELACDAAVIRRHKSQRALYARTLLKTQLAGQPLPFGCYWPARGQHPLEVRVGLLRTARRDDSAIGPVLMATAALAAGVMAWLAQPPIAPNPARPEMWEQQQRQYPPTTVLLIRIAPPSPR